MLTSVINAKTIWVNQDKPQQGFEVRSDESVNSLWLRFYDRFWFVASCDCEANKYIVKLNQEDVKCTDMASFLIYLRKCLIQYLSLFEYSEVAIDTVINRYLDTCERYKNAF